MTGYSIEAGEARGSITAPPSKSYTHRALVGAASLGRPLEIRGPLDAEDTRRTRSGVQALGFPIAVHRGVWAIGVRGTPPTRSGSTRVWAGESGTTLRFLCALAARDPKEVRFEYAQRLGRRPIRPLLVALESLGACVERGGSPRVASLVVRGPIHGGVARIEGGESSQFTSALLLALAGMSEPSRLEVIDRPVSRPYVAATCRMLRLLGASVRGRGPRYRIDPPRRSRIPRAFSVPGDASSAAYLWTAAAVSGGDVTVRGVPTDWPQADLKILRVLRASGTRISRTSDSVRAAGRAVRPVDVELTDAPDLVPLVGILAAGIAGRSRIRGAAHAIWKESDRRQGTARLVRELGGSIEVRPDQLVIDGTGTPTRIRRSASHDHRLVLSAAVAAVGADGESLVGRAEAVRKSYPGFWRDLRALGIRVRRFP